jgi:hypothetical protein
VKSRVFAVLFTCLLISGHAFAQACSPMPNGDPRWQQLDGQYARIERATVANNAQQLFAVYAPDFEAHMFNGEVWSFAREHALLLWLASGSFEPTHSRAQESARYRALQELVETTLHSQGESPSLQATESSRFEKTESL